MNELTLIGIAVLAIINIGIIVVLVGIKKQHNETMLGMKSIGDMVHDHAHGQTNYLAEIASLLRKPRTNGDAHEADRVTKGHGHHDHSPLGRCSHTHTGHSH